MLLRKIQPEDNACVATIIRAVMTEFGAVGPGYSIEDPEVDAMYEAYADDRSVFYVLQEGANIVGCGGLSQLKGCPQEVCELQKMYFLPSARGQGLGRLLGETLLLDARRLGYRRAYVETLERMRVARQLYQKLGFSRLQQCLGNTGHSGCDAFYTMELEPFEVDPSLLA